MLKRYKPAVKMVAVEPAESSVLLGKSPGPHKIEGVGMGFTPPLWEPALVDEVIPVRTEDAKAMTRRLAREEALFAGTSSGANVMAAIQVAERLGPTATVVTLMADSGLKYLNTDVYRGSGTRSDSTIDERISLQAALADVVGVRDHLLRLGLHLPRHSDRRWGSPALPFRLDAVLNCRSGPFWLDDRAGRATADATPMGSGGFTRPADLCPGLWPLFWAEQRVPSGVAL